MKFAVILLAAFAAVFYAQPQAVLASNEGGAVLCNPSVVPMCGDKGGDMPKTPPPAQPSMRDNAVSGVIPLDRGGHRGGDHGRWWRGGCDDD